MSNTDLDVLASWAASGVMALTGRKSEPPLGPPAPLVPGVTRIGAALEQHARRRGIEFRFEPLRSLADRAAIAKLGRRGEVSCGGATRLVRAADGWFAVSLARDDDVSMVPAWLEVDAAPRDHWSVVESRAHELSVAHLVERGSLLGMPVAALGDVTSDRHHENGVRTTAIAQHARRESRDRLLVVDLSSLWAGPLCGHLLARLGLRVVKVESVSRPDAARHENPEFFDVLNAGKESLALDFTNPVDIEVLQRLLATADIVIEGSRPRALEQLGISARDVLAGGALVWVCITGYGRDHPVRERVAFGDDAAVAGGLVVWDELGPCFCADAVADPLTGMVAATAALDALDTTHTPDAPDQQLGMLVDVAMSAVAAAFAGPTLAVPSEIEAREPTAPIVAKRAASLGEHSEALRTELARRT